mgnify:CR=1 FL=1
MRRISGRGAWAVLLLTLVPHLAAAERLGYPAEEFAARRERLARSLGTGTVVLFGATEPNPGVRFRQDNDFFYLTGNESLNAVLVLDAASGRRALAHRLPGISEVGDDGRVTWLVEIRDDGHTNLQLGLDIARGATGAFVAFEEGSIKSYAPGGFVETVVGRYDPAAGRSRFEVSLRLDLAHDRALLSVRSLADGSVRFVSESIYARNYRRYGGMKDQEVIDGE